MDLQEMNKAEEMFNKSYSSYVREPFQVILKNLNYSGRIIFSTGCCFIEVDA